MRTAMVIVIAPGFDGYTVVGLETGQTELKTAAFSGTRDGRENPLGTDRYFSTSC
jgi:hypothetical protein